MDVISKFLAVSFSVEERLNSVLIKLCV